MAASAGTMITLAGHAAAMAPETFIGAASPVGGGGEDLNETEAAKQKNALKSDPGDLRSAAARRQSAWLRPTIDTAAAASATEAKNAGLVDFIADNLTDLLRQLDGYTVQLDGRSVTLETAFAQVVTLNRIPARRAAGEGPHQPQHCISTADPWRPGYPD